MKKILGIIILGLLLSGNAYAKELKIYHADENSITMQKTFMYMTEHGVAAKHCAKYKKFALDNWDMDKPNKKVTLYCVKKYYPEYQSTYNGLKVRWTNYDANSNFVKKTTQSTTASSSSNSLSMSTDDKITQSKQICKDLGFKTNTEKFADCALKMMSIQFEATNKVASSSGGTTQEIIVKHKQDYDIFDAMLDMSNALLSNGNNSSSSSSNSNTRCVIGKTNPMFGTTTMNCR